MSRYLQVNALFSHQMHENLEPTSRPPDHVRNAQSMPAYRRTSEAVHHVLMTIDECRQQKRRDWDFNNGMRFVDEVIRCAFWSLASIMWSITRSYVHSRFFRS